MTIREAMLTLNGEGDAMSNPQPLHMSRMLARLAELRANRQAAADQRGPVRWGAAILGSYDSDIAAQLRAIARAVRINPALGEMAAAAGVLVGETPS
jgi:hypothetical protein